MRKTKIVCTLGPASSSEDVLERMLLEGMNIARFNFSHGTHEQHRKLIGTFRRVRDRLHIPAAVMLDTKGPEIRTGHFEGGSAVIEQDGIFTFTVDDIIGNSERCSVTYKDLPSKLKGGERILIDDGKLELKVISITEKEIKCRVTVGGVIKDQKSINIPYACLDMPFISQKDEEDLIFGIEEDVDFVAASFVRSKEDVIALRKFLDYHGGHSIRIISKIENNEGVCNFSDILEYSDGIMVARGDMGVEVDFERLPGIQKMMIRRCYQAGKMVITATQMLESMITSTFPTRAEISDVANAVFDGTSAVMLSGETAMGDHPADVVAVMSKICERAEADAFDMHVYSGANYEIDFSDTANAICDAACTTAKDINAKAIIAVTESGHTARRVSKFRPKEMIIAATPNLKTFHQLSLSWGVCPVLAMDQDSSEKLFIHAVDCAKQIDAVDKGDVVVITAGVPLKLSGTTNILKVTVVS